MIVRVRAGWLLPIAGPALRGGWMDVDAATGLIVGLGGADPTTRPPAGRVLDLGDAVVMPGLVNAHTHLELSHLAATVPPAGDFVTWVRSMLAARFGTATPGFAVADAVTRAIGQMEATGTAGIGDIANTDVAVRPLAASSLSGVHFSEALAFDPADAARVAGETRLKAKVAAARLRECGCTRIAASVAPHAPYSTSAPLIQALVTGMPTAGPFETSWPAVDVSSIHLGESREETEFLAHGTGPFRALLEDLGRWDEHWQPPGTGPVEYLQRLGALHPRLLVVHGTQLTSADLARLAESRATLVICARSNRWVGAGVPPVAAALEAGIPVAIGTDSLASVDDLNLFAELAFVRRLAPEVPATALLRAATQGGARGLGLATLGVLAPGATSRAVVRIPPVGVTDVEEWLVGDAAATADLRWLDQLVAAAAS